MDIPSTQVGGIFIEFLRKTFHMIVLRFAHNSVIVMYKKEVHNMPQIRPITDLRNTTEISELCHARREPLFITKNGYGDLVVMSIEAYEEMIETARTDAAISEAEQEYASDGVLLDAREALSSLRRKHFG